MPFPLADIFGFSNVQVALMVSGLALIYTIIHWRRGIVLRKSPSRPNAAESRPAAGALSVREISMELQSLLADLEETSRRLTAQLDNRHTRLEQLLAEADERIRRLEALCDRSADRGGSPAPSGHPAANDPAPAVAAAQRMLTRLRQERGAPPPASDPVYQPIYTLADRGKSPREIAQELGRQPGEVELILALRNHAS